MQAVIEISGQQFLVSTGDELVVDRIGAAKTNQLEPLLIFDDKQVLVGQPVVPGGKVSLEILDAAIKGPKVKIMKFQAKKRVKTLTGHRQPQTRIKIKSISVK